MNSVRRSRIWSQDLAAEDHVQVRPAHGSVSFSERPGQWRSRHPAPSGPAIAPVSGRPLGVSARSTRAKNSSSRSGWSNCSSSSLGLPSAWTRPLWMIATREQSFSTSCIEWVEKTIVLPWSRSSTIFCKTARCDQDVEARGRLVEDQDGRIVDDRPGDRDLLLHAGRHLRAQDVAEVVHLEPVEDRLHPLAQPVRRQAVEPAEILDQLPGGHPVVDPGAGRHVADVRPHRLRARSTTSWPATTARPPVGLSTVLRIRRVVVLPAPLGPSSPKISPGWQSKLDVADGRNPAPLIVEEGFAEVLDVDHAVARSVEQGP